MGTGKGISTRLPNDREGTAVGEVPVGERCAGGMDVVDMFFFNNNEVKLGFLVTIAKKKKGFGKEFWYILKVLEFCLAFILQAAVELALSILRKAAV